MKMKRRTVKKGVSQATKRTQARNAGRLVRRRQDWITSEQARQLAARHLMSEMFDGVPVQDGTKARLRLYNQRRKDVWVVFPNIKRGLSICSSFVVLVCKCTGRVLYAGSANDEG